MSEISKRESKVIFIFLTELPSQYCPCLRTWYDCRTVVRQKATSEEFNFSTSAAVVVTKCDGAPIAFIQTYKQYYYLWKLKLNIMYKRRFCGIGNFL